MQYTEIKEYEGYVDMSEQELRNLAMFQGDVIAHAELDYRKIRESVIADGGEIKVVRLNAEEVETERREIEGSGLIY